MSSIQPNGVVRLCANVPWDSSYTDVRKFGSTGEQSSYISSKAVATFLEVSYQRPTSTVTSQRPPYTCRVDMVADDLYNCNYMMFQNTNFGSKWFYAFVKEVNYINPNCTEIVYELDHYQTWCFDYTVLPSYVEREHWSGENGSTEPLFANVQPEPVSIGEYKMAIMFTEYYPLKYAIIAATSDPSGKSVTTQFVSGLLSGAQLYTVTINDTTNINLFLNTYAEKGRLDAVIALQMSPFAYGENGSDIRRYSGVGVGLLLDGYQPKNKKLYSYPYCYYSLENTEGQIQVLQPQIFDNGDNSVQLAQSIRIEYEKVFGVPPLGVATPLNYGETAITGEKNYTYSVSLGEIPPSSWSGNAFTNWLAQNGVNTAINLISGIAGTAFTASSGNIGAVISGATKIGGTVGNLYQATKISPQLKGNSISGNFNVAKNRVGYEFKIYTITKDYAISIDNFFSMYGYACNELKVPNEDSRESWNYVKCNNVVIQGSLPVDAIKTVKAMYNNGVRFWHTDSVGNYALSNEVRNNAAV